MCIRDRDKDVSTEVLTCYGYGDGGGGPTEEMLEQSRRLEHSICLLYTSGIQSVPC